MRDPFVGAPNQRVSFEGSYLPFPKTSAESEKTGDPRKSITERYASRNDYLTRYNKAADELVKQRWIFKEDKPALMHRAEEEWKEATK